MLYTLVTMGVLLGFASLGVDLGRVQVAKTELRRTADAAARAGASTLLSGVTPAQTAAVNIAAANTVDGSPLTLDTAADIEFGTWDANTRTFTLLTGANRSNANAMRITARRVASRGNAIPLLFAQILGRSTCDVSATSIAWMSGRRVELVGLTGVTVQNNFFGGTYRSASTTSPTHGTILSGAYVGSNAAINAGMNESLAGVVLGPSGTSNLNVPDPVVRLTSNMSFPLPSGATTNQDFTISGTQFVAGGTYYVDDLNMSNGSTLAFSGPATIYISGNVKFNGDVTIRAFNSVPGNLKIYHTGTGSFGSNTANNTDITADMYAPGVDLVVKNNAVLRGRFICRSIEAKNNLDFYYDESLTPLYYSGTNSGVQIVQ